MKIKSSSIVSLFVLASCFAWGQHKTNTEEVSVNALRIQDTINITIITSVPRMQLSFLMQGINITIIDSLNRPAIRIELPNARMVRDKIRHHPNEVKATHQQTGDEVRPDLLPLISALNDTCCTASSYDGLPIGCFHTISLNKTKGEMSFSISMLPSERILLQDSILVDIISSPLDMNSEFEGRRLSKENQMPPGGMGQAPTNRDDSSRKTRLVQKVYIEEFERNHTANDSQK